MIQAQIDQGSALRPTVEVFPVAACSVAQKEDEGWYFVMTLQGMELGEPSGPFTSEDEARREADGLFLD